jgi:transcriptional regulator with XRE-family HTH domain
MAPMAPAPTLPERPAPERSMPIPLRTVLAGNLRRLREEAGIRYDEITKAAAVIGLEWTPAWLTALEKGTKSPTAEQLLALLVVLSATFDQRVTLSDLLAGEAPVLLGPETAVRARHLRDLVTGEPTRRLISIPVVEPAPEMSAAAKAAEKMREIRRSGLGNVDIRALGRAEAGAGDAETKLARKLGVAPIRVIAAAASLWGRSLTEERDFRIAEGMGALATVNRKLTAELSTRLDEALRDAPID